NFVTAIESAEAHHAIADAALNDLFQTDKCSAAYKQDIRGIDANVLLLRMLASALPRHVANGALENLEQCLLHAFTGHIPCDRNVFGLTRDLVDFIDI